MVQLQPQPKVTLIDFGCSRDIQNAPNRQVDASSYRTNHLMGTYGYMCPSERHFRGGRWGRLFDACNGHFTISPSSQPKVVLFLGGGGRRRRKARLAARRQSGCW
jgi:hypothetical protein